MKRSVCAILCVLLLVSLLPISAGAVTEIPAIYLSLDYPEAGKIPPGTATWLSQGYTIHAIDWRNDMTGKYLEPGDKIEAGQSYTATLWVEASKGYEFANTNDNTPKVTAYINGTACSAYKAYEYKAWAMVCVDFSFSYVPEKGWIKSADVNIPAPVAGQKPSYDNLIGRNFSSSNVYFSGKTDENMINGVSWYFTNGDELTPSSAVFADETAYTVHFLLMPEEGYRFTPNARVTVNGQTAKSKLDYDHFLSVSYDFPKTFTSHTHTPSGWRTTGAYHYTACTTCGDFLEQEDHKGGAATCLEKGVCTVCGYAYQETTEDHIPDTSQWIARGERYHFHKCKLCEAHCDIGDHVAGPAGTPGAAVVCKDCGYVMTPAQDHAHNLSKVAAVDATCTKEGSIEYYKCDGCSDLFSDSEGKTKLTDSAKVITAPLGHELSEAWSSGEGFHWHACSRCQLVLEDTRLPHEGEPCTTCGYESGATAPTETEPVPETKPERIPEKDTDEKDKDEKISVDWLPLLLIPAMALAGVVAGIILVRKKKQ